MWLNQKANKSINWHVYVWQQVWKNMKIESLVYCSWDSLWKFIVEKNKLHFSPNAWRQFITYIRKYSILHVKIWFVRQSREEKLTFFCTRCVFVVYLQFFFSAFSYSQTHCLWIHTFFFFLSRLNSVSCHAFSGFFYLLKQIRERKK